MHTFYQLGENIFPSPLFFIPFNNFFPKGGGGVNRQKYTPAINGARNATQNIKFIKVFLSQLDSLIIFRNNSK